jgi:hypothetical protein
VNPRTDLTRRIARALASHAVRVGAPAHAEWTKAMMHEQEHLPSDASAVSWALGCVCVSYRGRIRAMIRLPDALRRMALLVILPLCLIPASWSFLYVVSNVTQDYPLSAGARLTLGLATVIGPIGFAAALWTLASPSHRPGKMLMVVLCALTAWATTILSLSAHYPLLTHAKPGFPKILMIFVVLPVLAVALLQTSTVGRHRPAD